MQYTQIAITTVNKLVNFFVPEIKKENVKDECQESRKTKDFLYLKREVIG